MIILDVFTPQPACSPNRELGRPARSKQASNLPQDDMVGYYDVERLGCAAPSAFSINDFCLEEPDYEQAR